MTSISRITAAPIWGRGTLVVALFAVSALAPVTAGATVAACGTTFTVVSTPDPGSLVSELHDVVAIASGDVWAVGYSMSNRRAQHTVTLHDVDGSGWKVVPSADAGTPKNGLLLSVDGLATNDVWAAGSYADKKRSIEPLTEHWDGSAWTLVPIAGAGKPANGELSGLDARTATDVWAVGSYTNRKGIAFALAEHWDGTSWTVVPTPNPSPPGAPKNGGLASVRALSATNAWAVGAYLDADANVQTLAEHWDGSKWTIVPTPDTGATEAVLADVTSVSSTAVWAVGFRDLATLVERWDGSKWTVVPSPTPGSHHNAALNAITAIRAGDLWAAGSYVTDTPSSGTLVEHWNGSKWTVAASDNAPGDDSLLAIGGTSAELWALGSVLPTGGGDDNLALHRCPG